MNIERPNDKNIDFLVELYLCLNTYGRWYKYDVSKNAFSHVVFDR